MSSTFWKLCFEADDRLRRQPKTQLPVIDRPQFAQSTVDATVWLIRFHPDRLKAWLERHESGLYEYSVSTMKNPPKTPLVV